VLINFQLRLVVMRLSIHGSDIGIFGTSTMLNRAKCSLRHESTSVRLIADLLPTNTIGYLLH
jgi:hypothetical protein